MTSEEVFLARKNLIQFFQQIITRELAASHQRRISLKNFGHQRYYQVRSDDIARHNATVSTYKNLNFATHLHKYSIFLTLSYIGLDTGL